MNTTSHATRVAMVERHLAGEPLEQIARTMNLSFYTVRAFWRTYRTGGWAAIHPPRAGPRETGVLGHFHPRIKYVLLRLKRQHPGWGVDKLRLELTRRPSLAGLRVPQRSALASYLAPFSARVRTPRRRPTRRPPKPPMPQLTAPHQGWQVDFKGDEPVDGIGRVSPLMVCDTATGAPLAGVVHTVTARGNHRGLTTRVVQADLRTVFTQWGLPDVIQVDNDARFIGSSRREWPGQLLLWLIGLGIQPHINRVYRPTDNAIVERNHQTWTAHVVEGQQYLNLASIQAMTDQTFADRRDLLPTRNPRCAGLPFGVAFPTLYEPRRRYTPQDELQLFDLSRVDQYLANWRWERIVDQTGRISLADTARTVGSAYRGQIVRVQFDPTSRMCVGRVIDGREVWRGHLQEFEVAHICGIP